MKAVNLIPDQQGGARAGRTGIAPYAVIAVLALLVVMAAAVTVTARSIDAKTAEVADVTARAKAAETVAADLKRYTTFAALSESRAQTVRSLAKSRFDWSYALHEVSRTIPRTAWLTSLRATVNPAAPAEGTSDQLRAALPVPAIELAGCATTQGNVARTMSALRRITGVQRVSLSASTASATASGGPETSGSVDAQGCGTAPQFSMTVFFEPQAGASSATAQTTAGSTP